MSSKKRKNKMLFRILTSLLLLLTLASCGNEPDAADKDAIVMATSADNPPYEYIQDGKVVGMDIDVINAIGKELGKKIVIKNFDFPGLLPALSTNNVDLVIAALTVTDERKEHIDFSTAYASSTMAVLFRKSDNFHSMKDLHGKLIGVQAGSTWEVYAKHLAETLSDVRVKSLANNLVLVEDLKASNVDVLIMEEMQVKKFIQNVDNLGSFSLEDTKSEFAIALPKGSSLTALINGAIKKLQDNGSLKQIKEKWIIQ